MQNRSRVSTDLSLWREIVISVKLLAWKTLFPQVPRWRKKKRPWCVHVHRFYSRVTPHLSKLQFTEGVSKTRWKTVKSNVKCIILGPWAILWRKIRSVRNKESKSINSKIIKINGWLKNLYYREIKTFSSHIPVWMTPPVLIIWFILLHCHRNISTHEPLPVETPANLRSCTLRGNVPNNYDMAGFLLQCWGTSFL